MFYLDALELAALSVVSTRCWRFAGECWARAGITIDPRGGLAVFLEWDDRTFRADRAAAAGEALLYHGAVVTTRGRESKFLAAGRL